MWGEGIEVMKTEDRGYGVRSMRAFEAGQIFLRESVGNWLGDELSVPKGVVGFLPRNGYILYAQRDHLLRPDQRWEGADGAVATT